MWHRGCTRAPPRLRICAQCYMGIESYVNLVDAPGHSVHVRIDGHNHSVHVRIEGHNVHVRLELMHRALTVENCLCCNVEKFLCCHAAP